MIGRAGLACRGRRFGRRGRNRRRVGLGRRSLEELSHAVEVGLGVDAKGGGFDAGDADAEAVFEGAELFEGFALLERGRGELDEPR